MGKFQEGDKVQVNASYSKFIGRTGFIKRGVFGEDAYTVALDDDDIPERGFYEHELEIYEDPQHKALIELAEMLDKARMLANSIDTAAPQTGVYGKIHVALIDTLTLITEDYSKALDVYSSMMENGNTVREALAEEGIK